MKHTLSLFISVIICFNSYCMEQPKLTATQQLIKDFPPQTPVQKLLVWNAILKSQKQHTVLKLVINEIFKHCDEITKKLAIQKTVLPHEEVPYFNNNSIPSKCAILTLKDGTQRLSLDDRTLRSIISARNVKHECITNKNGHSVVIIAKLKIHSWIKNIKIKQFSYDCSVLAIANKTTIELWHLTPNQAVHIATLTWFKGPITFLIFSADNSKLFVECDTIEEFNMHNFKKDSANIFPLMMGILEMNKHIKNPVNYHNSNLIYLMIKLITHNREINTSSSFIQNILNSMPVALQTTVLKYAQAHKA